VNNEGQITGIERNAPRGVVEEVSSWEIVNLRHVRGGLRPVGRKPVGVTGITGKALHVHVMDTVHNLISVSGQTLYFKNLESDTTKSIGDIEGDLLDVNHLGGVLVVSTTARKYEFVYDWDNKEYDLFPDLRDIQITMGTNGENKRISCAIVDGDRDAAFKYITSEYNLYRLEKKREGIMEGFMIVRYAIELLDGTYIWPSRPFELYLHDPDFPYQNGYGYIDLVLRVLDPEELETWAWRGWFTIRFPDGLGTVLDNYRNLIAGITVFGTTPQSWLDPIEDSVIVNASATYAQRTMTDNTPPNIIEKESFNLIKRYSVDDIISAGGNALSVLPDYETLDSQEKLVVEDEKLHSLHHTTSLIYNSRLLTGNITTELYDGWDLSSQMGIADADGSRPALYEFEIATNFGIKRTHKQVTVSGSGSLRFLRLISYPDIRATRVRVYYGNGTNWYIAWEGKLTPHPTQNFAYCFYSPAYWPSGHKHDWAGYLIGWNRAYPAAVNTVFADPNRVQASEVENPLVMPYKNSYQVGNSSVLAFAANGEPVSEGQFGQYPVYVFTREGMYMMDVGVEPFISSVRQINGEVCNSPKTVRNIGVGVLFTTDKGLMIINGLQVDSLSYNFEQEVHNDYAVRRNPLYLKAIGLEELGKPSRFVSTVPFMDYLVGANIGYDYPNREVWVCNAGYSYSYVFSMDYRAWSKRDESFSGVVDDYPRYYAQQGNVCRNLSAKEGVENMNVFILSNPIKIRLDEFKRFRRVVARGEFPVERMGMYLFGSIDGFSWAYVGGKEIVSGEADAIVKAKDVVCLGSHRSEKFAALVIAGVVTHEWNLTHVSEAAEMTMNKKLR
jgi:hypothetical protein